MKKLVKMMTISMVFVAGTSHLAMAQEATSPNAQYAEVTMSAMARVCELASGDNAVIKLSGKAHGACDGNEKFMPTLIKKGTRFTTARTGNEFNTLIANLATFESIAVQ